MVRTRYDLMESFVGWVEERQRGVWCEATFIIPGRWSAPIGALSECIGAAMSDLNRKVFKNAARRYGKQLARVAVPGGDPPAGVFNHYHMLIELPPHLDLESFHALAENAWKKAVKRLKTKCSDAPASIDGEVWMEKLSGDPRNYIYYMHRNECETLGSGIDKVDLRNSFLPPSHP